MKKFKKLLVSLLTLSLATGLLTACQEEEVVIEDTHSTIVVSQDQLIPEVTDEDLGIVRKDIKDLWTITGYRSWSGYNFLEITKNNPEEETVITAEVRDKDLFDALYDARLNIYVEPSYAQVSSDDKMYSDYKKGLRSLGQGFYLIDEDTILDDSLLATTDTTAEELIDEVESHPDIQENAEVEDIPEAEETESTEEAETEEVTEEVVDEDAVETQTRSEFEASVQNDIDERNRKQDLDDAIEEYMASVSLTSLTAITEYDLEGVLLGDLTADKIVDYNNAIGREIIPYEASSGIVYSSDLLNGVTYETTAVDNGDGTFGIAIKNDNKIPAIIYIETANTSYEVPMFIEFMPTDNSLSWDEPNNEWSMNGTDSEYKIRIERFNSDADLINELSDKDQNAVLRITDNIKIEKVFPSEYAAVINDSDKNVRITADTKDTVVLSPGMGVGIHKAAYTSLMRDKLEQTTVTETTTTEG